MLDEELSRRLETELAQPCLAGEAEPAPALPPCVTRPDRVPAVRGPRTSLRIAWDREIPLVRTGRAPSPKDRDKTIVPEPPVRRLGDHTLNGLVGQEPEPLPDFTLKDRWGEVLGDHVASSRLRQKRSLRAVLARRIRCSTATSRAN